MTHSSWIFRESRRTRANFFESFDHTMRRGNARVLAVGVRPPALVGAVVLLLLLLLLLLLILVRRRRA